MTKIGLPHPTHTPAAFLQYITIPLNIYLIKQLRSWGLGAGMVSKVNQTKINQNKINQIIK
jgi:hypothetical protein